MGSEGSPECGKLQEKFFYREAVSIYIRARAVHLLKTPVFGIYTIISGTYTV